ncbi:MAG: PRC-barrel domain-containing protein [Phycisphaerales bacterium JB054]
MYTRNTGAGLLLTLVAGTSLSAGLAAAQTGRDDARPSDLSTLRDQPADARDGDRARARVLHFVKSGTVLGSSVYNANGEKLGSVDDIVVNRGNGRIMSVVLRDGGLLGIGGKLVAVPYGAFGYDAAKSRLTLDVTPERLERAPASGSDEWLELDSDDWTEELTETYREMMRSLDAEKRDAYAAGIAGAETERVEGTITKVQRDSTVWGEEQVVVHVRAADGSSRPVILGPSWYVMSQAGAPMRGDAISTEAYVLPRDGQNRLVARAATIDGSELSIRNKDGSPRWDVADRGWADAEARGTTATSPLLRLTDLVGKSAHARDDDGGEIADAVLELESGRVAMVMLDPNENFLGIADDVKCVPWSVASVGTDTVRIDADREMLLECESMPEQVSVFASPARLEPVYRVFDVQVVDFRPRERQEWKIDRQVRGWSGSDRLIKAYGDSENEHFDGTVRSTRSLDVAEGMPNATAIVVRTDDGDREVVLGPGWYVSAEDMWFPDGAEVSIIGRKVRLDGQELFFATVVNRLEGERIVLWKDGTPVWRNRSASHTDR